MDYISYTNTELIEIIEDLNNEIVELNKTIEMYKYDSLTNLPLRIDFNNRIDVLIHNANYRNKSFTITMIDINDLHKINRTEGYEAGDFLIKSVARELDRMFPDSDIYRIGGDEFIILHQGKLDVSKLKNMKTITYAVETVCNKCDNIDSGHIDKKSLLKVLDSRIIEKKKTLKRRKTDRGENNNVR